MNINVMIAAFQVKRYHIATFVKISQCSFPIFILDILFLYVIDGLHILRHSGHVGGTTQKNMLLVPLSDPAGVGG